MVSTMPRTDRQTGTRAKTDDQRMYLSGRSKQEVLLELGQRPWPQSSQVNASFTYSNDWQDWQIQQQVSPWDVTKKKSKRNLPVRSYGTYKLECNELLLFFF